jgi:hypothetical protein
MKTMFFTGTISSIVALECLIWSMGGVLNVIMPFIAAGLMAGPLTFAIFYQKRRGKFRSWDLAIWLIGVLSGWISVSLWTPAHQ